MIKLIKEWRRLVEEYRALKQDQLEQQRSVLALLFKQSTAIGKTTNWHVGLDLKGRPFIEWENTEAFALNILPGDTLSLILPSQMLPDREVTDPYDPDLFQRYKSALACIAGQNFETVERCVEFATNALAVEQISEW
jgi:hypothetical protein